MNVFELRRRLVEDYRAFITSFFRIYDRIQKSIKTRQPYQTALDPLPADPRVAHGANAA